MNLGGWSVTHIPVQGQPANLAKSIILVRPHLGHIKDVPLVGFGVLWIHGLDVNAPDGIVLSLDGLVQVLQEEVWILSGDSGGFLLREILDALLGLDVHFDVFERAILGPSAVCSEHKGSSRLVPLW